MSPCRTLIALTLVIALAGNARTATLDAGGKKGNRPVHGKVVSVQKDAKGGSITIQVHHHKKKGAATTDATPPVEKTFQITANTKFQIVQGKKGAVSQKDADISAVTKGEHVLIFHNGTEATEVKIVIKGKGKKAA